MLSGIGSIWIAQPALQGGCPFCGGSGGGNGSGCAHCGQLALQSHAEGRQGLVQETAFAPDSARDRKNEARLDGSANREADAPQRNLRGGNRSNESGVAIAAASDDSLGDRSITAAARSASSAAEGAPSTQEQNPAQAPAASDAGAPQASPGQQPAESAEQDADTGEEEQKLEQIRELEQRDREVRAHEQAHISAGGSAVSGGARYEYTVGPDGKQYAVGGEVSIDTSPVPGNPEATIEKAQTVRRAALAPASPSAQDQKVAAQAMQMEAEARMEKIEEQRAKSKESSDGATGAPGDPLSAQPADAQAPTAQAQAAEAKASGSAPAPVAASAGNPPFAGEPARPAVGQAGQRKAAASAYARQASLSLPERNASSPQRAMPGFAARA